MFFWPFSVHEPYDAAEFAMFHRPTCGFESHGAIFDDYNGTNVWPDSCANSEATRYARVVVHVHRMCGRRINTLAAGGR